VEVDIDALMKSGLQIMVGNLVERSGMARHDPAATAATVVKLAQEGRRRRLTRS
jgi:hypothetical protein